jgi:hypothetical protein
MIGKLKNLISEVQCVGEDDDFDKTIVYSRYEQELNDKLIEMEHERMKDIHNLDAYLDLKERNDKLFREVNNYLHNTYGWDYQKEVLKEISFNRFMRKYTLHEIGEMVQKHEHPQKKRSVKEYE